MGAFRLSPDGGKMALGLDVFPSCKDIECTKKQLAATAEKKRTGHLWRRQLLGDYAPALRMGTAGVELWNR